MRSKQIGTILLGAAAAWALYRLAQMPKEERKKLFNAIGEKTADLMDDTDRTIEKVRHYITEIKSTSANEWIDKIYIVKKMLTDFYGSIGQKQTS